MMNNQEKTMEKIVALCKGRGFIFAGSEIYGGLANTWDYGPLGARMKNNVKDTWRKRFIQERKNSYEVDADILMHPRVWEASGHVASFSDPLLDCKECKKRHRADNLIDDFNPDAHADGMTKEEYNNYIEQKKQKLDKITNSKGEQNMEKRLYKSNKNKMLDGVCAGVAEYFNIDSTIVRLIWAIFIFCFGTGFLAYILAALVLPNQENY